MSQNILGLEPIVLDDAAIEALAYQIEDASRQHSIVLVSSAPSGDYLVNPTSLASQLVGLAEVLLVPPSIDTYWMANVLGDRYAAYRGAVNIIFPCRQTPRGKEAYTKKLLQEDLHNLQVEHRNIESEFLSIVTHRSNLPTSWKHISPEKVRDASRSREIARRREEAEESGNVGQYIEIFDKEIQELKQQTESLTTENCNLQVANERLDDEKDELQRRKDDELAKVRHDTATEIVGLKSALSATNKGTVSGLPEVAVEAIVSTLNQKATPEQSLCLLETLFPNRIIVLDSARKAAKDAKKFRHQPKAFDLLWNLATQYWPAKNDGKEGRGAGEIFGDDFSMFESDNVTNNAQAYKERTFEYDGVQVYMENHLKFGIKPSDAETLRIHFYWDNKKNLIVIGHSGKHLFVP